MPQYGIDWSKVDAKGRLAEKRDEVTAVTDAGANPSKAKSTRARRNAEPSTQTTRTRRTSKPVTEPAEVTAAVSAAVEGEPDEAEDENEGVDLEPENADGDKV